MRGLPLPVRLVGGLRRPKDSSVGYDVAGEVAAVGRNVTGFRAGDAVFGVQRGAWAEYVCGPERSFVPKPVRLTFEQAAAVSVAGCTALQGLRDAGRLKPGQHVLINGGSGAVGTFAVQIAKALGAHVTAVCRTGNVDLVRSLGADLVIDYTNEDFTRRTERYDLLLDVATSRSLAATRRTLVRNGTLVMIGAPGHGRAMAPILARLLLSVVWSRVGSRRLQPFLAKVNHADLVVLKDLIDAGKVTPVIDRTYPMHEIAAAVGYLEQGHARGKVVITV
jgi:NADPH:quinone reductase-like Zn-dependent oxidoreductase